MNTEVERSFEADMAVVLLGMERLVVGTRDGSLSFAAGEEVSPEAADLVALVMPAEGSMPAESGPGRWAGARAEFDAFLTRLNDDIGHAAVIRSGVGEAGIRTWVSWNGDTVSVIHPGYAAVHAQPHAQRLGKQILGRRLRLRMLTATATAAARIAMLSSIPGGGLLALPVAFRYVRTMSGHWSELLEL